MRSRHTRGVIFRKYIISYTSFILLSLCVMSLICFYFLNVFKEELNNVYQGSLRQIQSTFDREFLSAMTIANNIAIDNRAVSLANSSLCAEQFETDKYITMSKLQENLKIYLATNQYIDDIFLLFPDKEYVLTSKTHYSVQGLIKYLNKNHDLQIEELSYLFMQKNNSELVYSKRRTAGEYVFFVVQSIPPFREGQSAIIMLLLNAEALKDVVSMEDNTFERVLFLPDDFAWSEEKLPFIRKADYSNLMESREFTYIPYVENMVLGKRSEVYPIHYIANISSKDLNEKTNFVILLFILCFLIFCIAAIIMTFYWAHFQYKPLNKIMNKLNTGTDKREEAYLKNEYTFLESGLDRVFSEIERSRKKLSEQETVVRDNLLLKLIRGEALVIAREEVDISQYGIHFSGNEFAVGLFTIREDSEQLLEESIQLKDENEILDLCHILMKETIEQNARDSCQGYLVEAGGRFAVVFCKAPDISGEYFFECVQSECERALHIVKNSIHLKLFCAISTLHTDRKGIAKGYAEAEEIEEYAILLSRKDDILSYSEYHNNQEQPLNGEEQIMADRCREVVALIRSGSYSEAKEEFNSLIDSYISDIHSLIMARYRLFALMNQLIQALEELRGDINEDFYRELNMVGYFLEIHHREEFKKKMEELIDRISSYYSMHRQQEEGDLRDIDRIQEFINSRYMDSSLSAGLISDEFKINPTSLSRYFKKHTGEGILDYIHIKRIAKAEELLRDSQMTIKEVSEKVGYNSSLTMIRVFKRYRNCTPGQYREQHEKDAEQADINGKAF